MADDNELAEAIKAIGDKHWAEHSAPALLSTLPPLLEGKVTDYRTVLGTRSLKVFIKDTEKATGYKLVEHPTQHARVGIIPAAAKYEFPPETTAPSMSIASKSNREVTIAFFRALATLPSADLDKMVFPASVLVKLLK